MHVSGLAGRYAVALFELAQEQDALDEVARDLHALRDLLAESADLERLIRSPVLSRDEQARALAAVGERAGFAPLTLKFLGLLAHKRRLFALPDVIEAYDAMLAEHRGEVGAEVVSAIPLSDEQLASVREQLAAAVGQTVKLSTKVDPGLLGGLVVRVGSRMIDASIRTKLHQLELALKGAA
ncbi:MAG TPA: F0F1 ATP synthase subunit delta [Geminicoccaceae bacterium]|nr:F0F1 ATP synthase subunit delta [Geminicoccaceae bacterium]